MPTDPSGQPLAELKQWLAISTTGEDALLLRLLESAWQVCLQFTGSEAAEWAELDPALRHGIVRFAAHQYRERDEGPAERLPSAIAAPSSGSSPLQGCAISTTPAKPIATALQRHTPVGSRRISADSSTAKIAEL